MGESEFKGRLRSWFIIKVAPGADPKEVAANIYRNLGGQDHSEEYQDIFLLVRADVVDGCTLGEIIAPVDATIGDEYDPEKNLRVVEELIEDLGGVAAIFKATVSGHNPLPPHDAFGYVNQVEKDAGEELGIDPNEIRTAGLQRPRSPGPNKWG